MNLIRFSVKPNIRIITFLSIQIARYHIFNNLDTKYDVNSLTPNTT